MRCKCCGEKAEFSLVEDKIFRARYNCSNCDKHFWEDKSLSKGLKAVKLLSSIATGVIVVGKLANGDVEGAVQTALKIGSDEDTTIT